LGDSSFLVVNGDVFTEIDFAKLRLPPTNLAYLVMVDNPPQHPKGDFSIFSEKLSEEGPNKLTFSGVGVYHPSLFFNIEKGQPAKLSSVTKRGNDKRAGWW
jgi:MurNAc alpha-1-phosphate uridylyltransferase